MAQERDLEKGSVRDDDIEGNTLHGTTGSVDYRSDVEKAESHLVAEGATGEPDFEHEEVEGMDEGHLDDLVRQHVCCLSLFPINTDIYTNFRVRRWHLSKPDQKINNCIDPIQDFPDYQE